MRHEADNNLLRRVLTCDPGQPVAYRQEHPEELQLLIDGLQKRLNQDFAASDQAHVDAAQGLHRFETD